MKNLILILLAGLFGSVAQASPLTADQIYSLTGLTFYGPNGATATLSPLGSDAIETLNALQSPQGKTFNNTSNVKLEQAFVYDFATLGGSSTATIVLAPSTALNSFAANAVITNAWIDVKTAVVGAGAHISLTGLAAGDILGTTAITSFGIGQIQGLPAEGTITHDIKGATNVVMNITTDPLTAGHFTVFIDYSLSQ